ncbi:transient receptor potential cation channel [Echinococcus multilocularis]|uniref:Transient receptor potential cation channel n=1 Tax=Echinococcus multilocularis TaxID=6211 RepID=A0A068YIN2_ECHMU|nr:transient receptor potential cation channel [Echinococcus multilocularis]
MSTIQHRQSRVGSTVNESAASTAHSPHALLPSASIRRPSQVHRFHGEIEFTGLNQTARFAKLSSSMSDSAIRDLLQRRWGLKPPTLIITVFGTDFEKKRKLKMIFKKGLWKAADSGCWIVTGGFQLGIMKLAGEAVRDYTDAYGGNRMLAFGISSWGCVKKNDILEAALEEGTAVYQSEEDKDSDAEQSSTTETTTANATAASSTQKRTDVEELALDPNHNYFIFAETAKTDHTKGREAGMRARFERCISLWSTSTPEADPPPSAARLSQSGGVGKTTTMSTAEPEEDYATTLKRKSTLRHQASEKTEGRSLSRSSSKFKSRGSGAGGDGSAGGGGGNNASGEDIRIPMCGLVIGGDRFTLRQVYCSIMQNQCPMVVAKGTSGAADVIAFGLEAATKMETEEILEDKEAISLETRLGSVLEQFLREMHPDYFNFAEEVSMLAEIITDYVSLVLVFDMEEDSDLDGYMISSLLASAGTSTPPDQLNLEQLEITLTLNRADIAREKIFLENKRWKKGQLNDYMYQALMGDRHDFVKIFLEQGFSLEEFLTVYMLERLYTDQLKNMSSKVAIFNKMWEYHRSHRASKVTLRDVGKVIKSLVGDFYHPLYLSKEFQQKLAPEKFDLAVGIIQHLVRYHAWFALKIVRTCFHPLFSSTFSSLQLIAVLPNKFSKGPPKTHHNNRNPGGGGGVGATSTKDVDPPHKFKAISICPNVLGLHEPVSFIDFFDEHPKVKYKAASLLKQEKGEAENNPNESSSHLLFSFTKDNEVQSSPCFDTADGATPRGMQRSSTRTTTLSMKQRCTTGESIQMVSSGEDQSWAARQPDSIPSDGEYEVEEEVKVKRSRFAVTHMGLDKIQYGRYQKRRISFEKMKEIQVASGRSQYYGNPAFLARQHLAFQSSVTAPLAVDEKYSRPSPRMLRETSVESTYESQHTQQQSMSEDEEDEEEEDEEAVGFGGNLKRRFIEALRRRTSKDHEGGTHLEGLAPGNLQTLRAVAALAAVAGGMGGGSTDPEKTAANEEARIKLIQFDRPARELLIWSVLVGKLRMSELFWTMEKEPIAAALLASILLSALSNKTDDFTDKEDYKNYSKSFQEKAEGVLNECYREDEHRAQLIINHELAYYGHSSVIKLAAEGQSIKFMAHPCCQDFLTNTWKGNLSSKNSMFRMMFGLMFGLTMPLFIPKVLLYEPEDRQSEAGEESNDSTEQKDEELSEDVESRVMVKRSLTTSLQVGAMEFWVKIKDFYMSPIVRFVYHTISYVLFLVLFSYLLLVDFKVRITGVEYIVLAWVITLFIEEIKQIAWSVLSGISFSTYISDGWNKLDCTGLILYIVGFILRLIVLARLGDSQLSHDTEAFHILTDPIMDPSRICMAFSLFVFYIRLMYSFSFHIALGPKLIMIGKMVTNDLIPFMIILTVIMVGYAVAAQSIAYPNGFYTSEQLSINGTVQGMKFIDTIFSMYTTAYFQMFGDFSLDTLQGEDRNCQNGMCPTKTSRWLVPIMLGFYVLLTNILMFNLLIAMFSKTYEEIESASTYYWNYQRYQMIADYVRRSPLVPPLIIFWHFYEAYKALGNRCASIRSTEQIENNPFCVTFKDVKKEREMVKWEHMKAMDYLREPSTKSGGKRGGVESRAVVFRGVGAGSGMGPGPVMDLKSEMTAVTEGIGMELEKRFKDLDAHFQRFNEVDARLTEVTQTLTSLGEVVRQVTATQEAIMKKIADLPTCQCIELVDEPESADDKDKSGESPKRRTKLEVAVQSALEAAKDVLRPPTPPPPPPMAPPPPRDQEIPITTGAPGSEAESSGTEDSGGDPSADPVQIPPAVDSNAGRTLQRNIAGHRLWRFAPFNFEKYPGMRMNVPPDKTAWTTRYPDYFAYDSSEETVLYPDETAHDGENFQHGVSFGSSAILRSIPFNTYDSKNRIRRQSLLGRYRLDPNTGAPLNPMGRTGLLGKGLLPHWGPNHSIVIVVTQWSRNPKSGTPVLRGNKGVLQVIALERNKRFCLPWFFTDHESRCDYDECVPTVVRAYFAQRARAVCSEKRADRLLRRLDKADVTQIFKGYLDDQLNADGGWLETVVLNFHEGEGRGAQFTDDIFKVFAESAADERVRWIEVAHNSNLRTSHNYILKSVAEIKGAFY